VDLSQRRKSYTLSGTTVTLNPVLTDAQAATYTVSAVLGGSDNWQPQTLSAQITAPVASQLGSTIQRNDNADALCWVVFKNSKYVANVTTNAFDFSAMSSVSKGDTFTVRAANAMGGLGGGSNKVIYGTTSIVPDSREMGVEHRYLSATKTLRIANGQGGELNVRLYSLNGTTVLSRNIPTFSADQGTDISLSALKSGTYLLKLSKPGVSWTGSLEVW
jgi:hypothetical protein